MSETREEEKEVETALSFFPVENARPPRVEPRVEPREKMPDRVNIESLLFSESSTKEGVCVCGGGGGLDAMNGIRNKAGLTLELQ